MKTRSVTLSSSAALLLALASGCASRPPETRVTNPNQPGPAVGYAAGSAVGAIAGGVAGAIAGGAEGASDAVKSNFTNERRIIRTWRTETTADGRTIRVPVDTEVDEYGRPIGPSTTPTSK